MTGKMYLIKLVSYPVHDPAMVLARQAAIVEFPEALPENSPQTNARVFEAAERVFRDVKGIHGSHLTVRSDGVATQAEWDNSGNKSDGEYDGAKVWLFDSSFMGGQKDGMKIIGIVEEFSTPDKEVYLLTEPQLTEPVFEHFRLDGANNTIRIAFRQSKGCLVVPTPNRLDSKLVETLNAMLTNAEEALDRELEAAAKARDDWFNRLSTSLNIPLCPPPDTTGE